MNIVFLLRLWPVYGGGETVTLCLANEMVKRGWNVSILYFKDNTKEELPFIDSRIKAIRIEGIDYGPSSTEKASKLKTERKIVQDYAIQFIHNNHIDVVINQWCPLCFIDRLKKATKAKIIKVLHIAPYSLSYDENTLKGKVKRIFITLYKRYRQRKSIKSIIKTLPYVDRYVFLSKSFQKQFEEIAHYNNTGKLDAISNPLVFSKFITSEKFTQKENIVLIVGRMLEPHKKITRALRAWQQAEKNPISEDWKLQIVGEGPDLPMYKQLANELKLERVSFEGFQQPLPYYERAKIFLMTSAVEGFSMTLVESQQQGVVPIVMDTFLSLHDIITSDFNGIITPDGDERLFAEAMLSLMKDPQKLESLAQHALVSCKKFSVENIVDKWDKLINSI